MHPPPPREITPLVRRRAWGDPRVRSWWVLAMVMLVISIYLAAAQYWDWSRLNNAIRSGVTVPARVDSVDNDGRVGKKVSPGAEVTLSYDYKGKTYHKAGTLYGLADFTEVGAFVPLHIDPADADNWTARNDVPSLPVALVGAILVFPVAVIAVIVSIVLRARVLTAYAHGVMVDATVTANKQTPLAPKSRAVRCALSPAGRVVEVFVPQDYGTLAVGDAVQVVLASRTGRPIAAAWFEE